MGTRKRQMEQVERPAKWGRLTDDTLEVIAGQREQLIRKIQVGYGVAKEHAERQVKELDPVFDVTAAGNSGAQRKVVECTRTFAQF